MKFTHINPRNVAHFIPPWMANPVSFARSIDRIIAQMRLDARHLVHKKWDDSLKFWIDAVIDGDELQMRVVEPTNEEEHSHTGKVIIQNKQHRMVFPLNDILKGAPEQFGTHCVYIHVLNNDSVKKYVGITGRKWFERFAQHQSSARNGSHLLFHRALCESESHEQTHIVLLSGLNYEDAMEQEEQLVFALGLYPHGLNMIPGGFAGIKYLASLGLMARNAEDRDDQVERVVSQSELLGKPNPLCAARWATDQEFVNKVICGHTSRLTIDQVRMIRILHQTGIAIDAIAKRVDDSTRRVKSVIAGTRYARAA